MTWPSHFAGPFSHNLQVSTLTKTNITMQFSSFVVATLASVAAAAPSKLRRQLTSAPPQECLEEYVQLSLQTATLTANNLGGNGPWDTSGAPEMRYSGIGVVDDKVLDLVVTIKEGSDYNPVNSDNNGMTCFSTEDSPNTDCTTDADFGQINLGGENQEVTFVYTIEDQEGNPVVLPGFAFSAFDIDRAANTPETYMIKGWSHALYDETNTEAEFSLDKPGYCEGVAENCLYAYSTEIGRGCDNPVDAMDLGPVICPAGKPPVNRKLRSFMVEYENTSSFEMYFATTCSTCSTGGGGGRNVVFAFESMWQNDCPTPPTPITCSTCNAGGGGGAGGDPHFVRWQQSTRDAFHGECDLVLVHQEDFDGENDLDVHIRTTIEDTFSFIESAAVKIGEDSLEFVSTMVTLNGVQLALEEKSPVTFGNNYSIIKNTSVYGYPTFHIVLKEGVVTVKATKRFMSVKVDGKDDALVGSMGMLGDYESGEMKSREGATMQDFTQFGFEWQVNPEDPKIFGDDRSPQLPYEQCRMPTAFSNSARRTLRTGNMDLYENALTACTSNHPENVDACLDDVMRTGELDLADAW
jgi:hypothetical protein